MNESTSNREKGDSFARKVLAQFRKFFPQAQETSNSGARWNDGDLTGVPGVFLEVKSYQTASVSIKEKDWLKLVQQAKHLIPVLIVENQPSQSGSDPLSLAVVNLRDLVGLLAGVQTHE